METKQDYYQEIVRRSEITYILYLSTNDRIVNIKKRESNYKKIKYNILIKRSVDKLGTEKTGDKCNGKNKCNMADTKTIWTSKIKR